MRLKFMFGISLASTSAMIRVRSPVRSAGSALMLSSTSAERCLINASGASSWARAGRANSAVTNITGTANSRINIARLMIYSINTSVEVIGSTSSACSTGDYGRVRWHHRSAFSGPHVDPRSHVVDGFVSRLLRHELRHSP